ncbi:MAG TPA: type VI secretion system membrane subunit TssM [Steroidobacteraceae bacterium]|nr:type VI secretion system membrane subunit TssM [Steroidobacteraceae bacterium]
MAIFGFLKRPAVITALGFLLLLLFIWFAGPYFAFADWRPLASVWARLGLFLLCVAIWAGARLWKKFRSGQKSDQLLKAVAKQSDPRAQSPDVAALRERFDEATALLRKGGRGGRSLYDLPWYVIVGAPGSGKTTALVNSGLNMPLEQRFGKEAVRGVGGTRNCDWWFTEEAVFLDTAGRYTTQDSDPTADSAGWAEFLALLRKYRTRRPLNGVLFAVSATDLMTQAPAEREASVAAAKRRLEELNRELKIQLPVYLLVTKCDLVAGFTEYFDDLAQDGRAQVFGTTYAYPDTLSGAAAGTFPAEFDALLERLNARVFDRVEAERDVRRRGRIFAFPQQLAALRGQLDEFVQSVFGASRFGQQVLLRGVYFTSGTQEGTPIDRLMGAMGRTFGLGADAVAATPSGRGKAYFIAQLLRQVILGESGLAGVNRRVEMQKAALQIGGYAALALTAVLGVVAMTISYGRNRGYLAGVATAVAALKEVPTVSGDVPLEGTLPRLDAVRRVVAAADLYHEHVPLLMRFGLFQGDAVTSSARDAYVRELDGVLLPRVAARIRQRLVESTAAPDRLYEYLKAYLMLGQPEHLDKAQLGAIVDVEWALAYPQQPEIREALSQHFRGLLEDADRLRAMPVDDQLVAQARSTVRQASVPALMYSRLKLNYAGDQERAVHLDIAAGLGADQVFRRKSGAKLSDPFPALYTKAVFGEATGSGTAQLIKQFRDEAWVLGADAVSVTDELRLSAAVTDLYEKDYIAAWDRLLADIEPISFPTTDKAAAALGVLAAPSSPLKGLLQTVDQNTHLIPDAAEMQGKVDQAKAAVEDRLSKLLNAGKELAGVQTSARPGAQVTLHFAGLHQSLVGPPGTPPGQAPIDKILARLGQLQQQKQAVGTGLGETNPLQALARSGGGDVAKSLQADAALLPPVIGALVTQIGGKTESTTANQARSELETRFRQNVARDCNQITQGRYPFVGTSSTDVPLADFARLFGPGGLFDAFFKDNLDALVDSSRRPWVWKAGVNGASVGASAALLREFESAQAIRDMFFRPGNPLPELRFTVTPQTLDSGATRFVFEVDGQSFDYRHGPERNWPATWPGPNPGVAAVSFEDRAGGHPNVAFQGPWALFRLMDAGRAHQTSETRFGLDYELGGHTASVTIEAASIRNPFGKHDLQQFRCTP